MEYSLNTFYRLSLGNFNKSIINKNLCKDHYERDCKAFDLKMLKRKINLGKLLLVNQSNSNVNNFL